MGCGSSASSVYTADDAALLKVRCVELSRGSPAAELQLGGAVKLTAQRQAFNTGPLLDHGWLQGRMSPDEWHRFAVGLNDVMCDNVVGLDKHTRGMTEQHAARLHARLNASLDAYVMRVAPPEWQQQRGLKIQLKHPAVLSEASVLFLPMPLQPASAAAPPAYTQVASFGSPPVLSAAEVPPTTSSATFADVEKPGAMSADSADCAVAFAFCPLCAAPVEQRVAHKRFCPECGGKWR